MSRRNRFVLVLAALLLAALVVALLVLWKSSREQSIACTKLRQPGLGAIGLRHQPHALCALDPDGNGLACEELPLRVAPAFWTNEEIQGY